MNKDYCDILKYDEWLSSKLGYSAYHLSDSFTKIDFIKIKDQEYFIDAKIETSSTEQISTLSKNEFTLVDTNVQLKKESFDLNVEETGCRFAESNDKEVIANIAQNCFTKSRFHLDPLVPREIANIIKADWTRSFFEGKRGDFMIVAEEKGVICGFLQIISSSTSGLIIDLIGVSKDHQGKGYGRKMIAYALKNCPSDKEVIYVGTQLCNTLSINFYQKLGFFIHSAKHVFHLHHKKT